MNLLPSILIKYPETQEHILKPLVIESSYFTKYRICSAIIFRYPSMSKMYLNFFRFNDLKFVKWLGVDFLQFFLTEIERGLKIVIRIG